MLFSISLLCMAGVTSAATIASRSWLPDSAGYVQPMNSTASTTQYQIGVELKGGTSCGVVAMPDGSKPNGRAGEGPGFLYAAVNQLAFGANPGANAGGPGGACGKCVEITPVNKAGAPLTENALTFMLVDMCPVDSSGGSNCNQCNTQEANVFGHAFHFDIATDAMNKSQYQKFFEGVTDGLNWKEVKFNMVKCEGAAVGKQKINNWGCIDDCKNNMRAKVC